MNRDIIKTYYDSPYIFIDKIYCTEYFLFVTYYSEYGGGGGVQGK